MLNWIVIVFALLALGTEAHAGAVGPKLHINTYTLDNQGRPSVAALPTGGFIATWESFDGDLFGISAQMYDNAGLRIGTEFRVNTEVLGNQFGSKVTALDDGGFLVTWYSQYRGELDWGMHGQRYNAAGARVGGEFRISRAPPGFQLVSTVSKLADGDFVAIWGKDNHTSSLGEASYWFASRFDTSGTAPRLVGTSALVGGFTQDTRGWDDAKVAGLAGGGFVVVWLNERPDRILARQFDSSGVAIRSWTVASSSNINGFAEDLLHPNVVALKDGSFVITWIDNTVPNPRNHIYGQRYTANGVRFGGKFQIDTIGGCILPAVTLLADGGLLVVYRINRGQASDDILALRLDRFGRRVGGEFSVMRLAVSDGGPSVAGLKDGGFVVLWTGREGNYFQNLNGIFGQRFSF